jgi:hypothetical protein
MGTRITCVHNFAALGLVAPFLDYQVSNFGAPVKAAKSPKLQEYKTRLLKDWSRYKLK